MRATIRAQQTRLGQICGLSQDGALMEWRVPTELPRFAEGLGSRAWARILIESATESVSRFIPSCRSY